MSGATAGIIGGVVAAVLFLAILIYCCYRKKNKKAKYAEGYVIAYMSNIVCIKININSVLGGNGLNISSIYYV